LKKQQLLNLLVIFFLLFSLYPFNIDTVVGDPPIDIFLITSEKDYTDYGFTDLGVYYTPESLTCFHMPFIVERKAGFEDLEVGDLDKTIIHKVGSFDKRLRGYDFQILDSNPQFYVVDFSMETFASNETFSIDFVPKIKGVSFSQFDWWNSSWNSWVAITINHSYIDSTLTSFPVLVNITDSIGDNCQASGQDIRFLKTDNVTQLDYEIEKWVDGSDRIVWAEIDSISDSVNTTFLMYYNNPTCSDGQNPAGTWNSNYVGVYHMNDASGNIVDSTGTQNGVVNGTPGYRETGQFGWAIELDGVDEFFNITNDVYKMENNWCLEAWADCYNNSVIYQFLVYIGGSTANRMTKIQKDSDDAAFDGVYFHSYNGDEHRYIKSDDAGVDIIDKWLYYGCIHDDDGANVMNTYINETLQTETSYAIANNLGQGSPFVAWIGGSDTINNWDGMIEEIRISKVVRNDAWRKASFHTANLSYEFLTWGTPVSVIDVEAPSDLLASTVNKTHINISWTKHVNASTTLIERNTISDWDLGNGTEIYNDTGTYYVDNYSGLSCGTIYYYRGFTYNSSQNVWSGSNMSSNITCPGDPSNIDSVFYTSAVNFTWTNHSMADATIIVRKDGSFPSSPTDGTEVYNGTNEYYNDSGVISTHFYMLYSWNDTVHQFSDGERGTWGGLTINVYDENTTLAINNWSLFISNSDKTSTYESLDNNNPFAIDVGALPYGDDTMFKINATGYNFRIYYMDLAVGTQYTLNAYLPNSSHTESYLLRVTNEYQNPVVDARVSILRYINDTVEYENISILLTDGSGYCPAVWLIPNEDYAAHITASSYNTEVFDFFPIPITYVEDRYFTFQLDFTETGYQNETMYDETITFNGYISGTTLYINYSDTSSLTTNTAVNIYEYNSSNATVVLFCTEDSRTGDHSFQITKTITSGNCYEVTLNLNHTTFGYTHSSFIVCSRTTLTTKTDFDTLFDINFGYNPFGWSNTFGLFVLIATMFSFGQRNSGISLLLCGFILLGINSVIGLALITVSIPVIFICLGILVQWNNQRREYG